MQAGGEEEVEGSEVVRAMAAQREATLRIQMTIAEAIGQARWLRAHPDAILGTDTAKRLIGTLYSALEVNPIYLKAVELGARVFPLVEWDRASIGAINTWAAAAEVKGCRPEKVAEARAIAVSWASQPHIYTRWPT